MIKETTTKKIYIWNIVGSVISALLSMVLLMLVNRILGVEDGDTFSIAFSIIQLMLTLGTFQVRVFQSTDVINKYTFSDYFLLRMITCTLMVFATAIYAITRGYGDWKFIILMLLCFYRGIDAVSDVFQGLFQQKERLDIAGKATVIKAIGPVVVFAIMLIITKDLLISCIGITIAMAILFYMYDYKMYKEFCLLDRNTKIMFNKESLYKARKIAIRCLPLFLNAYLMMSIYNAPKLAIDTGIETGMLPTGTQTYYAIIFMAASVLNLIISAFRPLITSMAIAFGKQEFKRIYKILGIICIIITGGEIVILVASYLLGIPILSIIYGTGDALLPYKIPLLIVVIGGGVNSLATILDNVIVIFRKQHLLIISYLITFIVTHFISSGLVEEYGINGAAIAFLISMLVLLFLVVLIFMYSIKSCKKDISNNSIE